MKSPYIYALAANLCFAIATIVFTHYARKVSSLWVNTFKALIAVFFFFVAILFTDGFHTISYLNFLVFFISGFIALGIGDLFLLKSFSIIGPGRTMVLFGFHPLLVGLISYLVFDQKIAPSKLYVIIFFVLCLLTFSYEGFKQKGTWELRGLIFALTGVSLDAVGITITRYAFDMNKNLNVFEGNFYRCLGALFAYWLLSHFMKLEFLKNYKALNSKSKLYIFIGAFVGTFLSLAFYLEAIKEAHLATVSAISITVVIFSSLFESIWDRKWPSRYLGLAFLFFLCGMWILFKA